MLSLFSIWGVLLINNTIGASLPCDYFVDTPWKVLSFLTSVPLFMFFANLKMPQSKIINQIASSCFGVLLIHTCGDTMRRWLWVDVLHVKDNYWHDLYYLNAFLSIITIYVICTIIDQIRIKYIESPLFTKMNLYLDKR